MTWIQITLGIVCGLWLYDLSKWVGSWVHWYLTKTKRRVEKQKQKRELEATMARIFSEMTHAVRAPGQPSKYDA